MLRGPSHTCLGERIVPHNLAPLGMRVRAEPSHVFSFDGAGAAHHLLWLQTHEDEETLFGPVGIVRERRGGFEVEALGTLMARRGLTTLQLATFDGGQALWAVTSRCAPSKAESEQRCRTQLQVLPLVGQVFASSLEAPIINLAYHEEQALGGGWIRATQQHTEVSVRGNSLVLQETWASKELSIRSANVPPRRRKQSQGRRTLQFTRQEGWSASSDALWDGQQ